MPSIISQLTCLYDLGFWKFQHGPTKARGSSRKPSRKRTCLIRNGYR